MEQTTWAPERVVGQFPHTDDCPLRSSADGYRRLRALLTDDRFDHAVAGATGFRLRSVSRGYDGGERTSNIPICGITKKIKNTLGGGVRPSKSARGGGGVGRGRGSWRGRGRGRGRGRSTSWGLARSSMAIGSKVDAGVTRSVQMGTFSDPNGIIRAKGEHPWVQRYADACVASSVTMMANQLVVGRVARNGVGGAIATSVDDVAIVPWNWSPEQANAAIGVASHKEEEKKKKKTGKKKQEAGTCVPTATQAANSGCCKILLIERKTGSHSKGLSAVPAKQRMLRTDRGKLTRFPNSDHMHHYLQAAAAHAFYMKRVHKLQSQAEKNGRPPPFFPRVEPVVVYVSLRSPANRAIPTVSSGQKITAAMIKGKHHTRQMGEHGDGSIVQWRRGPFQWENATQEEKCELLNSV